MSSCEYMYICGPRKGEVCGRQTKNIFCYQHIAQIRKTNKKKEEKPVTLQDDSPKIFEEIQPKKNKQTYIQLENS